jgi:hypothetical protein
MEVIGGMASLCQPGMTQQLRKPREPRPPNERPALQKQVLKLSNEMHAPPRALSRRTEAQPQRQPRPPHWRALINHISHIYSHLQYAYWPWTDHLK